MVRPADAAWRAANYLCAAQLYLRRNVLLEEPLRAEDVKQRIVGHWGTAPGVNFILVHLSFATRATGIPILPVLGTGHAASSMLAWLYIEGSLADSYPELSWSRSGLDTLVANFGSGNLFRTELSAFLPGVFAANGELGAAHSIAQGIALDLTSLAVASIVGDGELETGPASASVLAARELSDHSACPPVLIVNMNGFRMGGRSILGRMDENDLRAYFNACGYQVRIVDVPDHAGAHEAFCAALRQRDRPQVLLVRSRKGVTFPEFGGRTEGLVGSARAHKAPLTAPARDAEELAVLDRWLRDYRPCELFEADGTPCETVQAVLPAPCHRIGRQWRTLPHPQPLQVDCPASPAASPEEPMQAVERLLAAVLDAPRNRSRFRIFSPDELGSNRLAGFAQEFPERILEILSEDVCHGWAEGYVRSGRHALLVSYEAFASRFATLFAQFLKFSEESASVAFRVETPSLNYLLTSLGWHNVYSHQNPDFISVMLLRLSDRVRVYLPVNGRRLVVRLQEVLRSSGRVNAVVASKYAIGPDLDETTGIGLSSKGAEAVGEMFGEADLVLAAAGDVACASAVEAAKVLRRTLPDLRVRVVLVEEIGRLSIARNDGLSPQTYRALFGDRQPVLFAFIGYAATIEAIVAGRPNADRIIVTGYADRAGRDFPSTLWANGMAGQQLAKRALRLLHEVSAA
jgi:xylulose-5-phosphate/fructose-6-phosphate phosphoketolase